MCGKTYNTLAKGYWWPQDIKNERPKETAATAAAAARSHNKQTTGALRKRRTLAIRQRQRLSKETEDSEKWPVWVWATKLIEQTGWRESRPQLKSNLSANTQMMAPLRVSSGSPSPQNRNQRSLSSSIIHLPGPKKAASRERSTSQRQRFTRSLSAPKDTRTCCCCWRGLGK